MLFLSFIDLKWKEYKEVLPPKDDIPLWLWLICFVRGIYHRKRVIFHQIFKYICISIFSFIFAFWNSRRLHEAYTHGTMHMHAQMLRCSRYSFYTIIRRNWLDETSFRDHVVKIDLLSFSAFTTDLRLAKILKTEVNKRALKYTHFEIKSIVMQENKFTRLI